MAIQSIVLTEVQGQLSEVDSTFMRLPFQKLSMEWIPFHQIRGAAKKKTGFFWEISPKCGWVGWLTPKQGPNPSKPPQIAPKIAFFDPNFTFRSPKSHKNPGVGGWVNRFGRDLPKKTFFFCFGSFPNICISKCVYFHR